MQSANSGAPLSPFDFFRTSQDHQELRSVVRAIADSKIAPFAVQLLGGYEYSRDYPVERMMRDAKITQIYEGTNQVQRIVMSHHTLASR